MDYGWFEGYAVGQPSTNNALEATNRTIKDAGTIRKLLAISQLQGVIEKDIIPMPAYQWYLLKNIVNGLDFYDLVK